ncbi:IclR family transcriptional regulator [Actinoplanes sp. RD1]|uniref:IclR family transcriptional regulator n=1 Tax=Actinoplanes sp. RD1 TaxID=3064538 RepID=UPI002741BEBD|nr:helix-turn-helix domain-containing protein [Actinoplanes sp. RD1]
MDKPRTVVDGAFRILHALPDAGDSRQVTHLSEITGLPRPTVYRLLGQLREAGAVTFTDRRWQLATGLVGLARRVEPHAGLRRPAADVLRVLRQQTGATVSLVVSSGDDPVVLEIVPGQEAMPADARPGFVLPSFTAAGIVLQPARLTSPAGVAVDHRDIWDGLSCYAVPIKLPGGHAALQIATASQRAESFAGVMHHAAVALSRHVIG